MSQALYRKWRPQDWDDVIGQDHVIQTLRNTVQSGRTAHAFLFSGPRGTGKTSTARLLAKALNCEAEQLADRPCNQCPPCLEVQEGRFLDLIEIDAASNTSVEDVRDLRDKINFAPNRGRYKVYIIDEVHMLSTAAFNALLKTLEEPPEHAIFILATTEAHKIPATVLSRCQRHEFRRIPMETMVDYLTTKSEQEGYSVEQKALELIARQATGSLRDAISLLDQLASTGETITLDRAQTVLGTASSESVRNLVGAWVDAAPDVGLAVINQAVDAGTDERQLARQIVDYLRGMLLIKMGNADLLDVTPGQRSEMETRTAGLALEGLLHGIRSFSRAASERRGTWQRSLPLEIALLESMPAKIERGSPVSAQQRPLEVAPQQIPGTRTTMPADQGGVTTTKPTPSPEGETALREQAPPSDEVSLATPAEAGELHYHKLIDRWRDVQRAARRHDPQMQALLNSCKPLGVEGDEVIIGFSSDLLRDKMQVPEKMESAKQSLEDVFGLALRIRCVLNSVWESNHEGEPNSVPVESDGMVATALRDLGAEVVGVDDLHGGTSSSD